MERYDTQIFAKNLSRLLELNHISQREIAKILSVSSSTVSSWCTGQKIPRMDKIERLASFFGVSKSDLIEGKPTPVTESGLIDPIDVQFMQLVSQLTPDQKKMLLAQLKGLAEHR